MDHFDAQAYSDDPMVFDSNIYEGFTPLTFQTAPNFWLEKSGVEIFDFAEQKDSEFSQVPSTYPSFFPQSVKSWWCHTTFQEGETNKWKLSMCSSFEVFTLF